MELVLGVASAVTNVYHRARSSGVPKDESMTQLRKIQAKVRNTVQRDPELRKQHMQWLVYDKLDPGKELIPLNEFSDFQLEECRCKGSIRCGGG